MNTQQEKNKIPLDWLVCPYTREPLKFEGNYATSSKYRFTFDEEKNFWSFIPDSLDFLDTKIWKTWQHLQDNGIVGYEEDPVANIATGPLQEYVNFGNFCNYKGNVLDIGVGPQKNPSHFEYSSRNNSFLVGLDPIIGEQPRDFPFIHGFGEFTPFKDNLFDQALFVTSLDHFIKPYDAILEANRVLKTGGELCIFHGEKAKNTPKPAKSPEWYTNLKVPDGAEDPFHLRRFDAVELEGYLADADFKITELETRVIDEYRKEIFYKAMKL